LIAIAIATINGFGWQSSLPRKDSLGFKKKPDSGIEPKNCPQRCFCRELRSRLKENINK
jgi:hypothetical protein